MEEYCSSAHHFPPHLAHQGCDGVGALALVSGAFLLGISRAVGSQLIKIGLAGEDSSQKAQVVMALQDPSDTAQPSNICLVENYSPRGVRKCAAQQFRSWHKNTRHDGHRGKLVPLHHKG